MNLHNIRMKYLKRFNRLVNKYINLYIFYFKSAAEVPKVDK